jgi:hypothetical protein
MIRRCTMRCVAAARRSVGCTTSDPSSAVVKGPMWGTSGRARGCQQLQANAQKVARELFDRGLMAAKLEETCARRMVPEPAPHPVRTRGHKGPAPAYLNIRNLSPLGKRRPPQH